MSVTVDYSIDELELDEALDDNWTHLRLYVANVPQGPYTYTNEEVELASGTYDYSFEYGAGNTAQWGKVVLYDGSQVSPLSEARPFHFGSGTTLTAIRQLVGELVNDMVIAQTTEAGTASAAACTAVQVRRFPDDYFNGQFFNDLEQEEWTQVSAFSQSTGGFTFVPDLPDSVADETQFELTARWTPDQYRTAINWAIVNAYPILATNIVYTGMRTVEHDHQYQVPNDIRNVLSVEIENDEVNALDSSTPPLDRGFPWRQIPHRIIKDGLRRYIEFDVKPPADRRLRIRGLGVHQPLYNESDFVELSIPEVYLIVYLAAHQLYAMLANDNAATDIDRYERLSKHYLGLYTGFKDSFANGRPAKKVWGHDARFGRTNSARRDYTNVSVS